MMGVLLHFCGVVLGLWLKRLHNTGVPAGCGGTSCGDGSANLGHLKQQSVPMCPGGHRALTSVYTTPPCTFRHIRYSHLIGSYICSQVLSFSFPPSAPHEVLCNAAAAESQWVSQV